jgi:hypothetical protein
MPNRRHDPAGKRTYVPGRNNPRGAHFKKREEADESRKKNN